ncbi:pilus assembly PilX family protein [Variovorax soli]|uniref:pilus assembly PilX family protein n=1 Tax=Variovorax soli TaxID=376815 RepID=UPI000839196C|nr:pilus assembly protein [Variovorax soli]
MALLVVAVMVLLAALVLTGALRTAWFNELITGTEADYQRALGNAQALLRDAELDIQGRAPDGGPCHEGAGFDHSCRRRGAAALSQGLVWFPQEGPTEFEQVRAWLAARPLPCAQGICLPEGLAPEFWRLPASDLDRLKAVAAHYGEFSGAPGAGPSNALLATKGWYWVEVLAFDTSSLAPSGAADLAPDADNPYIFRITAMAEGNKPATRAVLQSLLVWKRVDS